MHLTSFNPYYLLAYHSARVFALTYSTVEVVGLENIPDGACVFAANHMSHIDPPLVGSCIEREIYFLARKTLGAIPVGGYVLRESEKIIFVDLAKGTDLSAVKAMRSAVAGGDSVLIFPEGTRSPDGKMKEPKAGAGMLACSMGARVVPVRVFGAFDVLPRGSNLPRAGGKISVVFGQPLELSEFDPGKSHPDRYLEASKRIMTAIAALEEPAFTIA